MALVGKVSESASKDAHPFDTRYEGHSHADHPELGALGFSASNMDSALEYSRSDESFSADVSADTTANSTACRTSSAANELGIPSAKGDFTKRVFDIFGASALLLVLLPIFLIVGCVVVSDGGSAFFGHPRVGRGGRPFRCFKFRSMVPKAEVVLAELLATDANAREEWNRDFKLKNDVRVTAVGRFLRKTSLDELPQLWNVLRGDMSLVGPRPIVTKELDKYGPDARYYLSVRPGVTGLWQVSGRNNVDYATRIALDVSYVKERSTLLDISILLRTFKVVFDGSGAY
ncbi:lipopolysaccharide/colanic/teichoic acid biosynthesis glycosyltransferase [Paraburkholderia sp. BL6665CI2N2]|uniref:sugar transferase n=1 Tax=Paraburkholderia sp. BL6665CI2N2 TaxID=1938806 RepID=UPI001065729D|nr:sugar transferase [Paraburkholderia sp. BL6665CI2N2]TDY25518.1 lipopolysaccharide/colanic/teichoic acid biosynthesis glycosyltransferase [Paraburkholderia sp. BL6665CI2N2]